MSKCVEYTNYTVSDTCSEKLTGTNIPNCQPLDPTLEYDVKRTITYKNKTKDITIKISSNCQ